MQSPGHIYEHYFNKAFATYIAKKKSLWLQWAHEHRAGDTIAYADIIVVSGFIRARDWYVSAWPKGHAALRLSASGNLFFGALNIGLNLPGHDTTASPEQHQSSTFRVTDADPTVPPGTERDLPDDSIFIRSFHSASFSDMNLLRRSVQAVGATLSYISSSLSQSSSEGLAGPTAESERTTESNQHPEASSSTFTQQSEVCISVLLFQFS